MIEGIGKRSRHSVYWTVGLKLVHQLYHAIVMIVVARALGPSAFGVMATAWTLVMLAQHWTRFGLPRAIIPVNLMISPAELKVEFGYHFST